MAIQQEANGALRELALFAGAGGGILGGKLLGWQTVCAVERDAYAAAILAQRQTDGCLDPFPIWSDVETFDGRPWRGLVDVISGGFPCQDISAAGKGAGITGARSGLWKEFARIIGEVRPRFVFVENSPMLTIRGLGVVLGDLAALGYDARWGVLGAHHAGASHKRDRIWILANANSLRELQPQGGKQDERRRTGDFCENVADSTGEQNDTERRACECRRDGMGRGEQAAQQDNGQASYNRACGCGENVANAECNGRKQMVEPIAIGTSGEAPASAAKHCGCARRGMWWATEPNVGRVVNGMGFRVDRLKAIGNGQVPAVVKLAWETLTND